MTIYYAAGQEHALAHLGFEKEAFAGHLMAGLRAAAPAMSNAGKAIGMGVRSAGGAGRAAVGAAKGVAQNGGVTGMRQAAGAASQQGMQQAGQAFGQVKGHLGDAYTAMQPHLADAGKAIKGYGTSAMNMASMAMPTPTSATPSSTVKSAATRAEKLLTESPQLRDKFTRQYDVIWPREGAYAIGSQGYGHLNAPVGEVDTRQVRRLLGSFGRGTHTPQEQIPRVRALRQDYTNLGGLSAEDTYDYVSELRDITGVGPRKLLP